MAFMKVNRETVEKTGDGGSFIGESGVYDVVIHKATVDTFTTDDKNEVRSIGLFVSYNDNDQMLYSALSLDMFDGKENKSAVECFQRLMVIADLEEIDDAEEETLPIGKAGADKEVLVLPGFEDLECKLWIKQEFYVKGDGSIGENRVLKDVFTVDNKSADEIVNDTEAGVKYAKREKYFTDTKYGSTKKPLTAEEVQAWIEGGRKAGPVSSTPSAAPKASFGKKPSFGKK